MHPQASTGIHRHPRTGATMAIYEEYAALTQKYKAAYGPDAVVLIEVGSFMEYAFFARGLEVFLWVQV